MLLQYMYFVSLQYAITIHIANINMVSPGLSDPFVPSEYCQINQVLDKPGIQHIMYYLPCEVFKVTIQ